MSVVTVETGEAIHESNQLRPIVEQATAWLVPILEGSPDPVTAEWDLVRDMRSGDQYIELRISGAEPKVRFSGVYRSGELQDRAFAESSFGTLFLDMLRRRTHQLLRQLRRQETETASAG